MNDSDKTSEASASSTRFTDKAGNYRDGSLLKKKQEEWAQDEQYSDSSYQFESEDGGARSRKYGRKDPYTSETETNKVKGEADISRLKRKLESDISQLEMALDAQKSLRKYKDQIRELQQQVEIEERKREDIREQYLNMKKQATLLQSEKHELMVAMDQGARKQAQRDANEACEQYNELTAQSHSLNVMKRKFDDELLEIHSDLDETLNELKLSEERSRAAMADAAMLAEQLQREQENAVQNERTRKSLELQLREMQTRLEEAEAIGVEADENLVITLEARIRELENELDTEHRRHQQANEMLNEHERRLQELRFQVDEDRKNARRAHDLIDKLQHKIKAQEKQIEEAKLRQMQHRLIDAEDRSDHADNSHS